MKGDLIYLTHILERIERLEIIRDKGEEAFTDSSILQDAAIRSFEVIGEAVKQLSPELRRRHPNVHVPRTPQRPLTSRALELSSWPPNSPFRTSRERLFRAGSGILQFPN